MSKYAQAAVDTVRKNQGKSSLDMRQEWDQTMMEYYPTQKPSRVKGCPRNAFLGLSEEGLIIGIPAGDYGVRKGNVNKRYAVDAAALLQAGGEPDKRQLWAVVADAKKPRIIKWILSWLCCGKVCSISSGYRANMLKSADIGMPE